MWASRASGSAALAPDRFLNGVRLFPSTRYRPDVADYPGLSQPTARRRSAQREICQGTNVYLPIACICSFDAPSTFALKNVHIDRYFDEFTWRYNRREAGEGDRVNALLAAAEGRRITYPQLIE
jgi:hypothetical protein